MSRQQRQQEDAAAKLEESKPFRQTLEAIMRKSPAIARLFSGQGPLPNPFRPADVPGAEQYAGKPHPTIFKFKDVDYGKELPRTTPKNMRSRISFTTDVVNDYFHRTELPGTFDLRCILTQDAGVDVPNHSLNLNNGVATLNLKPPEGVSEGQSFVYELVVQDASLVFPFTNRFTVKVGPHQTPSGGNGRRQPHTEPGSGNGTAPSGLALPQPNRVFKPDWSNYSFNEYSALKVVHDPPESGASNSDGYSYYINMDNIYLQSELKTSKGIPELVRARWEFGMMLMALALLRPGGMVEDTRMTEAAYEEAASVAPQDEVYKITAAIAPILLPLIEHLSALRDEDLSEAD